MPLVFTLVDAAKTWINEHVSGQSEELNTSSNDSQVNISILLKGNAMFTARKRSLGQGNIFRSVCQEFCPQWGGGVWSRGGVWSGGCLVPGGGSPGRLLLRAVRILLEYILVFTYFMLDELFKLSMIYCRITMEI